ncbi:MULTISPECIES: copper resistance protein B [Sphingomonas]|uniref:copper resistance protein B n=1 Tax=Sphingomonas TaxID=13687 RepID=UPI000F7D5AD1|nr:copper resistance protein B [Sphingomonas sp. ABOLF]RSV13362.1 copper resistance protein B [Sphingomonas sp. ABOLF]GLK20444.1 copper resistance protein B [Microbacterium terregens]
MIRVLSWTALATLASAPALAQHHGGHEMAPAAPAPIQHHTPAADPHAGHQMPVPAADPAGPVGTDLPAGDAPPPPVPSDRYADRFFPPEDMARGHHAMMQEGGGQRYGQVLLNLAEVQMRNGTDGYRWDGEAFFGGDIDRLWIKSEGEGSFGRDMEHAEVQALYSRAIDPYFNLQAGVRQDFGVGPDRTYATVGLEGLAPYQFHTEAALFLSTKGDLLGRLGGWYDQRISQRLILQPRVELNFAAQDVAATRTGSGLSDAELGLRLRYELRREFAPYVGVSWSRKLGDTARFARQGGEDVEDTAFVAGVRFWF